MFLLFHIDSLLWFWIYSNYIASKVLKTTFTLILSFGFLENRGEIPYMGYLIDRWRKVCPLVHRKALSSRVEKSGLHCLKLPSSKCRKTCYWEIKLYSRHIIIITLVHGWDVDYLRSGTYEISSFVSGQFENGLSPAILPACYEDFIDSSFWMCLRSISLSNSCPLS